MQPTGIRRLPAIVAEGLDAYGRHATSQLAAAIAYRFLFSLVPFFALLVSVLDVVLPDDQRTQLVSWILGELPGDEVEASVDRAIAARPTRPRSSGSSRCSRCCGARPG